MTCLTLSLFWLLLAVLVLVMLARAPLLPNDDKPFPSFTHPHQENDMDPNVTLIRMLDAMNAGDRQEVIDAMEDLQVWFEHDGFVPVVHIEASAPNRSGKTYYVHGSAPSR